MIFICSSGRDYKHNQHSSQSLKAFDPKAVVFLEGYIYMLITFLIGCFCMPDNQADVELAK